LLVLDVEGRIGQHRSGEDARVSPKKLSFGKGAIRSRAADGLGSGQLGERLGPRSGCN